MLDIKKVKECVKDFGGYSDDTVKRYSGLIYSASNLVYDLLRDKNDAGNSRIIAYAAAKSVHAISVCEKSGKTASSFTVGDISISESQNENESAAALEKQMKECCGDMIDDKCFAFANI